MRITQSENGVTLQAIAGTHVVLLRFDATPDRRKGLLGFAIHREDHTESEAYWLPSFRTFEETAPHPAPGTLVSSQEHPIQDLLWGDYTAKPGHTYTYKVLPVYGQPKALTYGTAVAAKINTLDEDRGTHAIFFNRGVAGSQAFSRKFGNVKPDAIADPKKRAEAFRWLSRGLEEAILQFIGQAKGAAYQLRASVYEFSHAPVLEAFAKAAKSGADVKIIYDRRPKGPFAATEKAASAAGIRSLMIPRKTNTAISHNKFIVLLKNGKPIEVWTGSTNFTKGGIFGQSNVGHCVRIPEVAQQYLDYWTRLQADPDFKVIRPANDQASPIPKGAPKPGSVSTVFSPRTNLDALEWYASRLDAAREFAAFTAAFGISAVLAPTLLKPKPYLRYILADTPGSKTAPRSQPGQPKKPSQLEIFESVGKVKNNRIAYGTVLEEGDHAVGGAVHRWLREQLTGLNEHVKYLHTKYLILDALTKNPTVISGSANFSSASTLNNDENMLVIQDDTDVADAYLGEFMRLFAHFSFRDAAEKHAQIREGSKPAESPYLVSNDSWTKKAFAFQRPWTT